MTRSELERRLRRCSKADRDAVLEEFDGLRSIVGPRRLRERDDLRIVVRDQANHIRNLEAQLLPYLRDRPEAEQEALL